VATAGEQAPIPESFATSLNGPAKNRLGKTGFACAFAVSPAPATSSTAAIVHDLKTLALRLGRPPFFNSVEKSMSYELWVPQIVGSRPDQDSHFLQALPRQLCATHRYSWKIAKSSRARGLFWR
jgi:hypothetical protein